MLGKIFIFLIDFYRKVVSPFKPPVCRFYPSCSCYMRDAVRRYGPFKGVWLGVRRLVKCGPWHPGGYDPLR
ncbi:membrane protein insertion efficiency factor YidD [Geothermobacter hydrogeniphilus]|uniref:Putative membrane protein insertion efficiency factor n=1 Tax=Geothermobacter hydrogeniphilus TaxID=1969733 RepID=A0A2K2HAY8_9BACT|nr:membrane protein insertion efficiency factor YidD [Geothermobacter hydrogeniphilus]PNU20393.1 membrane protein insertion efficiency factor YidD [Geothermobacter hydrogeniphilus]